ncbi:hypothetical protein FHQ18_09965 [Deferribacter autotrophicus]|uniref:Uncharacterized protein n=2 Tax=Deferribacter autotrophicus TaxID=500465 RepID=A0A5A8F665_9BACT|nr:hypothetical protein FHQ18_09965 [Deferribacter autotrophicus]
MIENLVKMDLNNIKFVIKLYQIKYGKLPDNLLELKKKGFLLDENGNPILAASKFENNKLITKDGRKILYDNGTIFITN